MTDLSYAYRPSLFSPERTYRLTPDALVWTSGGGGGSLAYRDVAEIRVFKMRFIGASASYWTFELHPRRGRRIRLSEAARIGWRVENRAAAYFPFARELETRIAAANPGLQSRPGRNWLGTLEVAGGHVLVGALGLVRLIGLDALARFGGAVTRTIGPRLRGHRRAREQVNLAFPDKPDTEIEAILSGMWDHLGRLGAEYAHLDRLWDFDLNRPDEGRIVADSVTVAICRRLRQRRGPVMMFGAHLSNWEVSGLAGHVLAPDMLMIYKAPRIAPVAAKLEALRRSSGARLVSADRRTPLRIAQALKRGDAVAMLVDEYDGDGIEVTMFGRTTRINPLFARYVKMFDCPFHGFRTVRLPGSRFRLEITEAIEPAREASGDVDVAGTMQIIATKIEGWVREHPEQFFWLHRR